MHYSSLWDFINILEKYNLLIKIDHYVDPVLEIAEITDRISKQKYGGKALLFTNTGTGFPVVTNLLGSEARIALALRHDNLEQIGHDLDLLIKILGAPKKNIWQKLVTAFQLKKLGKIFPVVKKGRGACQEVVIKDPDITQLPVLQLWPGDGGRFITLPLVHTKDPITGQRNVGMYRVQIFGPQLTGMHWHRHKTGANHFRRYKKVGKKMPVAIALGGDPVYTYVATAPLPEGIDEYLLAGYLRGKPVELVKCITQDIEVPADADIVIEGYIDPEEEFILEGPFGDHTGFYSKPDYYPRFHVTAITHRKNAVYPATLTGVPPQEDAYFAKATERIFLPMVKNTTLNEVLDWDIPVAGCGHNFTIVQIKKTYPGQGKKVINALWGAGQMMFNKIMVVVSQDIDIHNYEQVLRTVLENFNPRTDLVRSFGPLDVLDHASEEFTYGSKLGIDATEKLPEEKTDIPSLETGQVDWQKIVNDFDEIKAVNTSLIDKSELPVAIFYVEKKRKISALAGEILRKYDLKFLRLLVFVDNIIPEDDLHLTAWLAGNNVAPGRDVWVEGSTLIVDATFKLPEFDDIKEPFPGITVMADEVIRKVDENWEKYGFKEFLRSYSLKFRQNKN